MSTRLTNAAFALLLLGSTGLFTTPTFAVEPDVDSPGGPELLAPRTDRPDFQMDDQSGAALNPQAEGADPSPPAVAPPPDVVTTEPGTATPE